MGFQKGFLTLLGFLLVGVVLGQDTVHHPVLGDIKGYAAVTSKEMEPYYTFHGIPYADTDSYMGQNRFKPSKVHNKKLTEDDSPFLANKLLYFCPQNEIFEFDEVSPREEELGLLNTTRLAAVQDLPTIYRNQHIRNRARSEKLRSVETTEERLAILRENDDYMGVEDCLTININTPSIPADPENPGAEKYPVVVFFHGGGSDSVWGSAFTALRMLDHKVVLITLNYRLGILGALNLGTHDAPGCAGLYDSVTALQWIKENIKYFGGDPNSVTITGQSAGSMMVTNLLLSPITKGKDLFHRVWGFSGSAISIWAVSAHPSLEYHLRVSELAGCYDPAAPVGVDAVAACMKEAPLNNLVTALAAWRHEEEYAGRLGYDARAPSIQAPGLDSDPEFEYFMTKHPHDILEALEQLDVPVVLGATRHDGSFPLDDIYNNFIKPHGHHENATYLKNEMMPYLLSVLGIKDDTGELYHAMSRDYFGNASTTGTMVDKLPGMLDMVTTMAFKAGSYEILRHMHKLNPAGAKAYFYSLDYVGRWSLYNFLWGDMYIPGGVCHTDDLIYFFWLGPLLNEDMRVSRRWMDYFINFVHYGDVNGDPNSPDYVDFWKSYDPVNHYWMKLDRKDKVLTNAPDHWVGASAELFVDWDPSDGEETSPATGTTPVATGPTDPTATAGPTDPTATPGPTDPTATAGPTDPTATAGPTDPTATAGPTDPSASTTTGPTVPPNPTTQKSSSPRISALSSLLLLIPFSMALFK